MWGEFSCSGFGFIFPSEGTINANEYNTILSDYFHPLESLSFSSKMTATSTGHKRLVNSLKSLKTISNLCQQSKEL